MNGKQIFGVGVLVTALMVGVASASAQDADGNGIDDAVERAPVTDFSDGRVNRMEAAAPVAVYCTTAIEDDFSSGVTGVEVWGIDATGNGYPVFNYSMGELEDLIAEAETTFIADDVLDSATLVSEDGFSLYYNEDEQLTIGAPDHNGTTYTFTWTIGGERC